MRTLLNRLAGSAAPDESVVGLIRALREPGAARPAAPHLVPDVVRRIADREPASQLRLFVLLTAAGLAEEATEVLRAVRDHRDPVTHAGDPAAFTEAFRAYRIKHQPDREVLGVLLTELVGLCDVPELVPLYFEVRDDHLDADRTIGAALAARWPVERIAALAARLEEIGWKQPARALLRHAVDALGAAGDEAPGIGTRVAQMLAALAGSPVWKPDARQTRELIGRLAARGDVTEVMNLIAGLHAAHRYPDFRRTVESEVLDAFDWRQLAGLPGVRGVEFLPAVLEIEMTALTDHRLVPAARVADIVRALREAGAGRSDLTALLGHVGHKRRLDGLDVTHGLRAAGLHPEADTFAARATHHRPTYWGT